MTINTHYTPNFTQLQTLNNINNDATIKDRNQAEQDLQQSNIQDGFSQDNAPNAPDFDRLQALNAINNDGEIKDRSQVEKNLIDGENTPEIYSSLDTYRLKRGFTIPSKPF
ncbi:hypothetical protein [Helicobacter pylori]|uniref:hypothetical protein n=1 Tax=Helicobacter pylori TaxID=210 RepID=UPI0029287CE5|nr:hypothetical protein [Helicobacter pylori]MDU9777236.1 hypothetical protein [Helicobacter pylori]